MLRSTPECARSCHEASRRARWIGCVRTWHSELGASWRMQPQPGAEISWRRWPASFRCRRWPEFAGSKALESAGELMFYGMQLAADKADHPGDDIVTHLITADVDGHKLSDEEFGLFMVTLTVAGNETTRNSITQGMMAFLDNPEQWATFKDRRPPTAADEIIRWAA